MISWLDRANRHARRAAEGDARAFAKLYRGLHPLVHGYVARRIANDSDAEDLVAKVFHRIVEYLDRFDPARASVRGWALGIARNAVIDHLRTKKEHAPFDDVADLVLFTEPPQLPGEADERTLALRNHVAELPAITREMIAMHFADGLGYREIAEACGATEAAVKQRMARALRELRERVAPATTEKGATAHAI
ncbi:MAG TPA: sigma-70 family RNA polymerase sigma factor [Nannocystaceae bacterium]|nr:sigma-70 family RNA polymerase sigma factor [Nannocystaceae bacterium]